MTNINNKYKDIIGVVPCNGQIRLNLKSGQMVISDKILISGVVVWVKEIEVIEILERENPNVKLMLINKNTTDFDLMTGKGLIFI